jgi:hypothetical protein
MDGKGAIEATDESGQQPPVTAPATGATAPPANTAPATNPPASK